MTSELPTSPASMMRQKKRGTSQASVRKGSCPPPSSLLPSSRLPRDKLASDPFTQRCSVEFQSSSDEYMATERWGEEGGEKVKGAQKWARVTLGYKGEGCWRMEMERAERRHMKVKADRSLGWSEKNRRIKRKQKEAAMKRPSPLSTRSAESLKLTAFLTGISRDKRFPWAWSHNGENNPLAASPPPVCLSSAAPHLSLRSSESGWENKKNVDFLWAEWAQS